MKKILLTAISFVLVAALAIGGTLAYLTDRDAKTNVFTVGNVDITLNEDFAQGSQLVPGVEVEKNVTVSNTGKNAAWVWVEISVPAELKDAISLVNGGDEWSWTNDGNGKYTVSLKAELAAGSTTSSAITKVKFADNVDITPDGDLYLVDGGNTTNLNWNIKKTPAILVSAYAIQTENFSSVEDAQAAYAGQWGNNGNASAVAPNVTEVATADELADALANGGVVVLTDDIALDVALTDGKATHAMTVAKDASVTVNLNGHDIELTAAPTVNANYSVFQVKGDLEIVGNGTVAVAHTGTDMGWGALSAVVSVEGGSVTVGEGVVLDHKGGTAMAYGIDVNTTLGESVANINGAIVKSSYIGVRIFNNHTTQQGIVNVNSGVIDGVKRDIWVHNPSAKAVDTNGVVNFADKYAYDVEVQSASSYYGRIYTFVNTAAVNTGAELKSAISNVEEGGTIVLTENATISGTAATDKLVLDKDVTIDLNGQMMTTESGWGGIDAKGSCSIVNGVIDHTGNTAAIKAYQVEKIENVVINLTQTAGKVKAGIAIQSGNSYVGSIKNVTIIGATNGIECYRTTSDVAIGSMENVKINATNNGIFINGAGKIGSIVNCEIYGGNIGINAYLANLWHISLNIKNSKISGGTTGIDIWDEGATNTGSTVVFNYDDATTFAGSRENIKVTLQEEINCTINGAAQATPCDVRK